MPSSPAVLWSSSLPLSLISSPPSPWSPSLAQRTIHGLLGVSRLAAGLGFAAMLAIIVVLLEVFLPEHGEATHRFDQVTWSPVLCGAVVGLLQVRCWPLCCVVLWVLALRCAVGPCVCVCVCVSFVCVCCVRACALCV
jgi:hypothetical protein